MKTLSSVFLVLLFAASMYGWGRLAGRWCYRERLTGWAFPAALGIAVSIGMGGLLNAVHFARPPVLAAILITGFGLAIFFVYATIRDEKTTAAAATSPYFPGASTQIYLKRAGTIIFYCLLLAILLFLVSALMPARSFNIHDDYHVYLMWPVRMLQTGSLGGNPFDHIGLSSLGAQSYMQGMFLSLDGSIADINAFDAILCLLLVLGLIKEFGERLGINIVFILAACILALLINPHYVNVSSLYSASLMFLGLAYATLLMTESLGSSDSPMRGAAAVPVSFFLVALLALKATYVFLAPLFWSVSLIVLLLLIRDKKKVLLAHLYCAASSIILLGPWLIIHLDRYLGKIHYMRNGISYPADGDLSHVLTGNTFASKGETILSKLFSHGALFYGNTYMDYLGIFLMLSLAIAAAALISWRERAGSHICRMVPFLAVFASVILIFPIYYKMTFFRADQFVRYTCPFLIGAAVVAVLLTGFFWARGSEYFVRKENGNGILMGFLCGILLIFQLMVAGSFRETFIERVKRAGNYGSLISFPLVYEQSYIDYNDYVLNDGAKRRISGLQSLVPAGESILAWMSMPMHLDYGRNQIYPTFEFGMTNYLLVMPLAKGKDAMRRYFQQLGIRYFIWEYNGYGMKNSAKYGGFQRKFILTLKNLLHESRIVYDDGGIIVFDIGSQPEE